jgi:hypothetical protein
VVGRNSVSGYTGGQAGLEAGEGHLVEVDGACLFVRACGQIAIDKIGERRGGWLGGRSGAFGLELVT